MHSLKLIVFFRYREYCTRRLKRLRKVLNFKFKGDRKGITLKKVTEDNFNDPRFVFLNFLAKLKVVFRKF